jgi:hypothetical protein
MMIMQFDSGRESHCAIPVRLFVATRARQRTLTPTEITKPMPSVLPDGFDQDHCAADLEAADGGK